MFDKNKKYIFSKDKLLETSSAKHNYNNIESFRFWIDECDGKPVTVINEEEAWYDDYCVMPDWCIEI